MKKITLLMATAVGVLATPYLWAQMNHGNMGGMGGMDHSAHQPAANAPAESAPALPSLVQAVFDSYIKIQTALAQDSMQDVSANAAAITVTVQTVNAKLLSPDMAQQAKILAQASDLKSARDAFKPLSDSLIKYLDANKAYRGHYTQVFCSMTNARWLQTGSVVSNPYLGKDMARCGQIKN
jgi:hypothetical protein